MPPSQAHLALGCDDILYEIFRHVQRLPPDDKPQRALYACARVCQVFCEPALDTLWMELDSLQPILELFEGCQAGCNGYYYCLSVVDLPENLVRFRKYAPRVRTLAVPREMKHRSEKRSAFLAHLSYALRLPPCTPLFPRLASLTWGVLGGRDPSLPFLLSPHLRALRLHCVSCYGALGPFVAEDGPPLSALLAQAAVCAPALRELRLTGLDGYPPSAVSALRGWDQLRTVSIADVEVHAGMLRMLAEMRVLEEVDIRVGSRFILDDCDLAVGRVDGATGRTESGTEWPALRRLTLSGPSTALAAALLAFSPAPRLSALRLSSTSTSSAGEAPLISAIPALRHLRSVRLELSGAVSMDEALSSLASAWPPEQLLEFELKWHNLRGSARLSARVLEDVARHCRALHKLALPPVDFPPIFYQKVTGSASTDERGITMQNLSVRELTLQSMPPTGEAGCDASAVATYIERLFPALDLGGDLGTSKSASNTWDRVERILRERSRMRSVCIVLSAQYSLNV